MKKFIIIDGHSISRRAFHALPPLTNKAGELTNAVYGFCLVLFKTIREFRPDFFAVAFDLPTPTFRHERFSGYKATRKKTPVDFLSQLPKIKNILKAFDINIFEKAGFEADDIIGAIVSSAKKDNLFSQTEIIVLSTDTDLLQLTNIGVKVLLLRKGISESVLYNEELVKQKYQGLAPNQLADFKALRGDAADNIPGVVGIGEKTAIKLINEFKDIDNLYRAVENGSAGSVGEKLRQKIIEQKENAYLSRDLARICSEIELDYRPQDCVFGNYHREAAEAALLELGFTSLVPKIPLKIEFTADKE